MIQPFTNELNDNNHLCDHLLNKKLLNYGDSGPGGRDRGQRMLWRRARQHGE